MSDFKHRYPHGVLVEQEGGIPNDVENWEDCTHVCRKHRVSERVCRDVSDRHLPLTEDGYAANAEDCDACGLIWNQLSYPYICPGNADEIAPPPYLGAHHVKAH